MSGLLVKPFGKMTSAQWRSSRPEVFLGNGVLKICSKFTGDTHAEQLY